MCIIYMNYLKIFLDCIKLYYVPYLFVLEKTITKDNITYIKNYRHKKLRVKHHNITQHLSK
jgi:hypothetical protein